MAELIEQLTIYRTARRLEDEVYELVKKFPADEFYGLGNDLRRSSASVAHHIMGAHRLYSYRLKLDELSAMRRECEETQKHLESATAAGYLDSKSKMIEDYTEVIKASWGLSKWLKSKLEDKAAAADEAAKQIMEEPAL